MMMRGASGVADRDDADCSSSRAASDPGPSRRRANAIHAVLRPGRLVDGRQRDPEAGLLPALCARGWMRTRRGQVGTVLGTRDLRQTFRPAADRADLAADTRAGPLRAARAAERTRVFHRPMVARKSVQFWQTPQSTASAAPRTKLKIQAVS